MKYVGHMYIKNIQLNNTGPIKNLVVHSQFAENQKPHPIIFIGGNGSGKSLVLSSLVDAIIELKRNNYQKIPEVEEGQLYKLLSRSYIKSGEHYSDVKIEFETDTGITTYRELASNVQFEDLVKLYGEDKFSGIQRDDRLLKHSLQRHVTNAQIAKKDLDSQVFLYFSPNRSDDPAWLNNENSHLSFSEQQNFIEISAQSVIKQRVVKEIEKYLLDVLFDMEVYEKHIINLPQPQGHTLKLLAGYGGRNSSVKQAVDNLLTTIYKRKFSDIKLARIGVSTKANRSLSILIEKNNGSIETVSPTFSHLSSGEIMLLGMFCSILRAHDLAGGTDTDILNNVRGIVIIDEVDLHLHIDLQRNAVPQLIAMFPQIQFIITTHSPFFLVGLNEVLEEKFQLINLPEGSVGTVSAFSEFVEAYNMFVDKNTQFKNSYEQIKKHTESASKPIIITEGKTDWKHLKAALRKLKASQKLGNLDIAFEEYEADMGDETLLSCCQSLAKISNLRPVIFLFDRDNESIIKKVMNGSAPKAWGNNVYSMCIPVPLHRSSYNNISIEFYYTDEELKTLSDQSTRLYFTNEISIEMHKSATTNKIQTTCTALAKPNEDEEADKRIYDTDCSNILNSSGVKCAHSKSYFADAVYNEKKEFKNFSADSFLPLFELIESTLNPKS